MSGRWCTASRLTTAYADGTLDPVAVTRASLEAARASDASLVPLGAFVVITDKLASEAAALSAARWRAGASLGPLDGVPVAIKDMTDLAGFATTDGTTYRNSPARRDSVVVERLRAAGAIIVGKTSLHEVGLGGTGINPGHITARNPHDRRRLTGGSSSGSAAAVAAGLVPIALGSDAGGSIRIPAGLCGVTGLKGTFGRVPTSRSATLCWSLDHMGPIGASVDDCLAFFKAIAGPDTGDEASLNQPPMTSEPALGRDGLSGVRVAWCPQWGDEADAGVRQSFHDALDALRLGGATVEEVTIPYLEQVRPVGYMTLGAEAAASQAPYLQDHRSDYGADSRLLLAMGGTVTAVEYLHAQRVRTLIRRAFLQVLSNYDVFATPTTACVAPIISEKSLKGGEVDSDLNAALARYSFAGNLTGFPAISIPGPIDEGEGPVGLQLMAGPWQEARLCAIARRAAEILPEPATPEGYVDLMEAARAQA